MVERANWRNKMVTIKIFAEGGAHPRTKPNVETVGNSVQLRSSFNQLLNSRFQNEKVQIDVELAYSNMNAIRRFQKGNEKDLLLIDLDDLPSAKSKKIGEYKLQPEQERVFFMIQTMESWLLSQPKAIQKYHSSKKAKESELADDARLKGIHPSEIPEPDKLLNALLGEYFQTEKNGKVKPLKYGKLKNSYELLKQLDIFQLEKDFAEVQRLFKKIDELF